MTEPIREENVTQDGGVKKIVLKEGTGETPTPSSNVVVHYDGYFADSGEKFDSSRDRNREFKFKLGQGMVISAWDKGIATMRVGEIANIICSPEYAYGEHGSPPKIPPSATLRFHVELLSFEKDPETAAEKTILATRHKDEGNAFFKVGKYQEAFDTYQKAIDLFRWTYPTLESETVAMNAVKLLCHLNQAACQLKLKHWASARMCAEKALDVDETNVKARFRRGQAYCGMGEFDKAKDDIEMCLEREPDNADLAKELARIQHEEAAYQKKQNQVFSKMGSMFGGSK